ncbi:MAG TPA: multiheme c-type cytochrome [Longimicrobiales bacterium]|nr:multiheme c-type cytochrome [Longimicrobiales bacterium]
MPSKSFRPTWSVVVALLAAAGCIDERVVYEDVRFPSLPAGAASYIGYSDEAAKRTVCGNCHVGQQSDWAETAHADAWATLQESGHAQAFCEGCHTVGSLGNASSEPGGFETTRSSRYHDVQCESCHGAGLLHIENPDATQPLAPLAVGTELTLGCGQCHSGAHHPFVDEWVQSGHGSVQTSAAGRPECQACHTGENALQSWGVRAEYLEKIDVLEGGAHLPITCGVCHDPHDRTNPAQLRFPIDIPSEEENLCMKCHHKRGQPDPTTFRGPHSPEGPVLLGYAGWFPPSFEFTGGEIIATHGTERNPRLCAGCHVNAFTVTDPATGDVQFRATGHLFKAVPCLDASGIPTTGDCEITARTFRSCVDAACHASEADARGAMVLAEQRAADLVVVLGALLAQVPADEFDNTDARYTTAEGSRFNMQLAAYPGSAIHNPFLIESLLIASIRQIESDYGLVAGSRVSRVPIFAPALR